MSDLSDAVAEMLAEVRQEAGFEVDYETGDIPAFTVTAVKAKMPPQVKDQFDQRNIAYGQTFEIAVAELLREGQAFLPVRGHKIAFGCQLWEVLDRPDVGRPWDYVDSGETTVRIYTIETSR